MSIPIKKFVFTAALSLPLTAPIIAHAQPSPLFSASFDKGTTAEISGSDAKPLEDSSSPLKAGVLGAGISVPRGKLLVYEGAGNVYIPSGTLSFFWRPDEKIGDSENDVFTISGFQRFYFCRWLRLYTQTGKLRLGFYNNEYNNDDGKVLLARDTALTPGAWHHIAVSWDQGRGIALYVDGKLADSSDAPWFYGGNINQIGLAVRATSYARPGNATWAQSFDEVRIYENWMDAADIARLSKNEKPRNAAPDLTLLLQERARRLGLENSAALPQLSVAENKNTLQLQQVALLAARDVLSTTRAGLDGDLGRAWPMMQGYADSGKQLEIAVQPGSAFNTLQLFGSGPMEVMAGSTPILKVPAGATRMETAKLAQPLKSEKILVRREDGLLFNVQLFNSSAASLPVSGQNNWTFQSLNIANPQTVGEPNLVNEFASYDRRTLATDKATNGAPTLDIPAMRALHLLGPSAKEMRGLSSLALDLALRNATPETTISLMVVDPLNYERRTAMVNFKISGDKIRVVLDVRDLVLPSGARPWLILYSQNPLQLDVANSRLGFQWNSVDAALSEFLPDQMAYARDAFQELSEARPWAHDPDKRKWLRSLFNILDTLHTLRPHDTTVSGYWHWTHPKEPIPISDLPKVPAGTPPWAIYTNRSVDMFRQSAYWWIDNRMTPAGEFGAPDGINDDTDLIQDWLAIDLMHGPDPKIRKAIELVANASWHQTTVDGVSKQITDTLHMYEWGINAQTLAFVQNIGDPVYYGRLLRFASHYDELTARTGDKNHRHFKTWYFGASKMVTEGVYGQDREINALLLQPAMLLAWYNGDAASRDLIADWSRAMMDHIDEQAAATARVPGASVQFSDDKTIPERNLGIAFPEAVWAAYDLTGDKKFLDAYGRLLDYEISRKPQEGMLRTPSTLSAYLRASSDRRFDEFWKKNASDPTLWTTSQHNDNYRALTEFYAAWLQTGDDEWLNKGSGLALHHMTWSLPMLTSAEQTTDRVWLPQSLANRMTLGDLSILRNQIYPKHAVSWEYSNGQIAPLVRRQSDTELEIEIHNLENREVKVGARLWRLNHGRYEIRTTSAPQTDENKTSSNTTSQELTRFDVLPLALAPSSVTKISIKQTAALPDLREAADLGISHLDATFKSGVLSFKVHNIGAKASGAFQVRVMQNGRVLMEKNYAALPAPENFRTHKAIFTAAITDGSTPVTVEIVPQGDFAEITKANNRITFTPSDLPEKEWTAQ